MSPDKHLGDIVELRGALKRQQMLTGLLGVLALALVFAVLSKRTTIILEPPTRTKSIAVEGDRVDAAWLEEMGTWVAHMMLDASPASVAWQQEQILRWTHPGTHAALQQRMAVQAQRLRDANASTVFWPQQVSADPANNRVVVIGQLQTLVNGARLDNAERTAAYMAEFESQGGRMLLKNWQQVATDDVWMTRANEAAAAASAAATKAAAAAVPASQ